MKTNAGRNGRRVVELESRKVTTLLMVLLFLILMLFVQNKETGVNRLFSYLKNRESYGSERRSVLKLLAAVAYVRVCTKLGTRLFNCSFLTPKRNDQCKKERSVLEIVLVKGTPQTNRFLRLHKVSASLFFQYPA